MMLWKRLTVLLGLILLFLVLFGCRSTPPVVMLCPPIPESLTLPCETAGREIVTNGDLARAYVEAEGCRREDAVRLKAIRELADCRVRQ